MSELISIDTEAGAMPALMWLPEAGTGPGIVVAQEIFGTSAYLQRRCADLAAAGYVVVAPQFMWRLGSTEPIEGPQALQRAMAQAQQLDWDEAVVDGARACQALRADPAVAGHRVGLVGFCFGGGLGFNIAAVERLDALVCYYGSALPRLMHLAPMVIEPSLHHFGDADEAVPLEQVLRIREAVSVEPDTTFYLYEGAGHAFDNDDAEWFDPAASALAWRRTLDFLDAKLR